MFVGGPQRGLFVGCLGLGLGSLLLLDLYFAPATITAAVNDHHALSAGSSSSSAAASSSSSREANGVASGAGASSSVRVVIPAAARVPTIVARFPTQSKEPIDQSAIRTLAAAMIEDHDVTIVLEGHSDTQGGQDYNHDLSLDRAEWVKARLVELGVSPDRIETVGLGATHPLRGSEDGRAINRRVEVRWLVAGQPKAPEPLPLPLPKKEGTPRPPISDAPKPTKPPIAKQDASTGREAKDASVTVTHEPPVRSDGNAAKDGSASETE